MARLEVDLRQTEDPELVKKVIRNIFPKARLEVQEGKIVGEIDTGFFFELLKQQQIRGAIASVLDENASNGESFIDLSKMAAIAGKLGIDEGFALGKIRLFLPWKEEKE